MNSIQKKFDIISKYDQTAKHYDKRYNSIQNLKFNLIFQKIKKFKTDIILDLGCGTGLLFNLLKNRADLLVGMDISKKMLEIALISKKSNYLHLICADAEFLPFRNNIFSTIFSITVLQNLPNPVISINEVSRVCKKGGFTIFTALKKDLELKQFENMFNRTNLKEILTWNMHETEDFATIRKKI
ncbi:MAG: class I SAM-dependent methyltransferase [Candidatus Hodarchaeota archaeon]